MLVGVDADPIQLRILAHYMDDVRFTEALVKGRKKDGTDPHPHALNALGERAAFHSFEPLVIANRIATHVNCGDRAILLLRMFSRRDARPPGPATLCLFFTIVFCLDIAVGQ